MFLFGTEWFIPQMYKLLLIKPKFRLGKKNIQAFGKRDTWYGLI